jgi:trans-aconitate methyltransferase
MKSAQGEKLILSSGCFPGNSTAEMKRRLKQASERIDDLEQELRRANKVLPEVCHDH